MMRSIVKGAFELARRAASEATMEIVLEIKGDSVPITAEVTRFSMRLKRVEKKTKMDKPQ